MIDTQQIRIYSIFRSEIQASETWVTWDCSPYHKMKFQKELIPLTSMYILPCSSDNLSGGTPLLK